MAHYGGTETNADKALFERYVAENGYKILDRHPDLGTETGVSSSRLWFRLSRSSCPQARQSGTLRCASARLNEPTKTSIVLAPN